MKIFKKVVSLAVASCILAGAAPVLNVSAKTSQGASLTALEAERDGIVLLRNENNALPVASGKKIALFGGAGAMRTAMSGTGSADNSRSVSAPVSLYDGLKAMTADENGAPVKLDSQSGVARFKIDAAAKGEYSVGILYTAANETSAEIFVDGQSVCALTLSPTSGKAAELTAAADISFGIHTVSVELKGGDASVYAVSFENKNAVLPGDVNLDSDITAADALLALQHAVGKITL